MKRLAVFLILLILFTSSYAQDSTGRPIKVVVKPALLASMVSQKTKPVSLRVTDSLMQELVLVKNQNDSLLLMLNSEISNSQSLLRQVNQLTETNNNLNGELKDAKGDQLQTSHTSSILLIFNIIAGIILLVTLFWIYSRKKNPAEEQEETISRTTLNGNGNKDHMETRMERIEKLGRLRDKGLLTEEEFQLQKKQILD
jgi:hypothetical protein